MNVAKKQIGLSEKDIVNISLDVELQHPGQGKPWKKCIEQVTTQLEQVGTGHAKADPVAIPATIGSGRLKDNLASRRGQAN